MTGNFHRRGSGGRKFARPFIDAYADAIEILDPAPIDPFDVPRLETQLYLTPDEIGRFGRRSAVGRVLAVWSGCQFMIRSDAARIVNVKLLPGQPLPVPGTVITVVGQPETDLYRINLHFAQWRPEPGNILSPEPAPTSIKLSALFLNVHQQPIVNHTYHGRLIRVSGRVIDVVQAQDRILGIQIEDDGQRLSIDCRSAHLPSDAVNVGSRIRVVGYCLMELSSSAQNTLTQAIGQAVVLRSGDDLETLTRPPWWTPGRFILAVLVLLAILAGVFLWNLSLHVLVNRRNRQLFRSQFEKARSELRVDERTRLAVELHDSLAQDLVSISMELTAALCKSQSGTQEMMPHLAFADKNLKACCLGLRDTLWDLRSEALEEPTVERAIRKTLLPHLKGVSLTLRFNVPRKRFSDKTLHEVLCIIRELTVNAIRHGKASAIRIAGTLDKDVLRFSVGDNGNGFDLASAPGASEGHYGLSGIHDRLRRLGGALDLKRQSEGGMRAIVTI